MVLAWPSRSALPGTDRPCYLTLFSQDAQANGYVASLDNHKETRMGILHAVYGQCAVWGTAYLLSFAFTQSGLGAFSAPLVSTHFSTARHWSYHYFSSLSIAVTSAVVAMVVFRFKTQNGKFLFNWLRRCFSELYFRVFTGDRTTARGGRGYRTQRISSNFSSACGTFDGVLHSSLCWVRLLPKAHQLVFNMVFQEWKLQSVAGS